MKLCFQVGIFDFELVGVSTAEGFPRYPVCGLTRLNSCAATGAAVWIGIASNLAKLEQKISFRKGGCTRMMLEMAKVNRYAETMTTGATPTPSLGP